MNIKHDLEIVRLVSHCKYSDNLEAGKILIKFLKQHGVNYESARECAHSFVIYSYSHPKRDKDDDIVTVQEMYKAVDEIYNRGAQ